MPHGLSPWRAAAAALRPLRRAVAAGSAVRGARRYARASHADVIVCWDLDNTLVDSGTLLRQGMSLVEAVVAAAPMTLMLEFFVAVSEAMPRAEHVVLSARPGALRTATTQWLTRHGVEVAGDRVWLVPDARAKEAVWRSLARRARLVVVDDLSYGHESDVRSPYDDLVEVVSRLAAVHVGLPDIAAVAADVSAGTRLARRVAERLERGPLDVPLMAGHTPAGAA